MLLQREYVGILKFLARDPIDQRILAPEFEHHRFERIGGGLHHRAADRHGPDQRDCRADGKRAWRATLSHNDGHRAFLKLRSQRLLRSNSDRKTSADRTGCAASSA
jgi:hypothetical protein